MKKIPTLFARDRETGKVDTSQVTPGCEWVLAWEGVPTRKFDGTCVMFDGSDWWGRREMKPGKTPPPGWLEADYDEATGKRVGWEPIEQSPFVKAWREAVALAPTHGRQWEPWTYELCGPKVNGNHEEFNDHRLIRHGGYHYRHLGADSPVPADPVAAIRYAEDYGWEGIVWWRDLDDPDCDKAKLKIRDLPVIKESQ